MARFSMRALCQKLLLGFVLVATVSLLSVLFTFLGTITCAVATGMMLGAGAKWKWDTLLASLVFPGVVFALVKFSRADVVWPQNLRLALLCWGAFWVTYFLTFGAMALERKQQRQQAESAAESSGPAPEPGASATLPLAETPQIAAGLDELQGKWSCEFPARDGVQTKLLEFVDGTLTLSVTDANGKIRHFAKGDVKLGRLGPFQTLEITELEPGSTLIPPEIPGCPRTWLFRMADRSLTIAANFESAAQAGDPRLETYRKV